MSSNFQSSQLSRHKQKQVDLSVPWRTSGLVSGAKLELVQKSNTPSAIQVALQVPLPEGKEIPGGRLIDKFPSNLTVWKVLRQFESGKASNGKNINITARGVAQTANGGTSGGGQLYYETPVLNIMGRELASFAEFQKTLSQLGYNSGSVLIRLTYRTTDQTLYDAMGEISQFFKETEEEEGNQAEEIPQGGSEANSDSTPQVPPQASSAETPDTPMTDAQSQPVEEPAQTQPSEQPELPSKSTSNQEESMEVDKSEAKDPFQPLHVFLAPTGTTPAAALAPAIETDYVPSIAHAQLHQARLQENSRNKRLLSDKELEEKAEAEAAKIAAVKSILVRVRFPDNTSSEWEVGPEVTGAFLYEAVRHVMLNNSQPFRLVLPGGKPVIKDDGHPGNSLIKAYKISGRILINLVWDDAVPQEIRKQPFLKSNVAQKGQEVKVPEVPQVEDSKEDEQAAAAAAAQKPEKGESNADKLGKKVPKWLKLGKK